MLGCQAVEYQIDTSCADRFQQHLGHHLDPPKHDLSQLALVLQYALHHVLVACGGLQSYSDLHCTAALSSCLVTCVPPTHTANYRVVAGLL